MDDDVLLKERKEKILRYLKNNYNLITYALLAVIVFIAVWIRTRNLPGLKDVTTGTWTLGPDLDPFLFLRWAKHIVENGSLMAVDYMRYVPLGYETSGELILHPYMIAWFHNIVSLFGAESVTHSAVLYPVFFFGITVIAFFLLVRKIFIDEVGLKKANAIALVSSFFLSIIPVLLPRTIAGIPEKESAALFFLFAAFYFFISAWKSDKRYEKYVLATLAGLFTAGMALVWGGFIYIFVTIALATFISFFLGQVTKERFYVYSFWIFSSAVFMMPFSSRYNLSNLVGSSTTGVAFFVFILMAVHNLLYNTKLHRILKLEKYRRIPKEIISLILVIILALIGSSILFGPTFIFNQITSVYHTLVIPEGTRVSITVAENRQPYFQEWANNFGPILSGIPVFFWLFFVGSVYLFYNMVKILNKKERIVLSTSYLVFLICLIFSKYRNNHVLNGENFISSLVYFLGVLILLGTIGFYYYRDYKQGGNIEIFRKINYGFIFIFAFFFFGIISARGSVRTIMMLVPPASIIVGYFIVSIISKVIKNNKNLLSILIAIIIILGSIFSAYSFYNMSIVTAKSYVPSQYTQQWQQAMGWVRDNIPENAVFGHWWDYGYWVQSMGERATVLDGGNAISYWNHFMGRHALTGTDEREALEFLYAHNTTHFLIDSSDIGKYTAFSSIGSDENYDRRSWVTTLIKDSSQTVERKNSIQSVYLGGSVLDEDIIYEKDGQRVFLPGVNNAILNSNNNLAGLGAVLVEFDKNSSEVVNITGLYLYSSKRYEIPLRYGFYGGKFIDLGEGVEAGVFIYPRVEQDSSGIRIDESGAMHYLSGRTVKSQLAKIYLYDQDVEGFTLIHTEDDFVITQLKNSGAKIGDFVYFQGFRGPIKIWEINYPENIIYKEEFLDTQYPENLRST